MENGCFGEFRLFHRWLRRHEDGRVSRTCAAAVSSSGLLYAVEFELSEVAFLFRFSEAQLQRQKKLESVVSNMHKQLLEASAAKKQQLREQIGSSLAALSSKRDAAAAELTQSLEAARAKKQQLLLSFQEQEKACQVGGADLGFFQVRNLNSAFSNSGNRRRSQRAHQPLRCKAARNG